MDPLRRGIRHRRIRDPSDGEQHALGGLLGAAYAVLVVLLAKPLGAAALTAALVTGQLVCSIVFDHFGWVGFAPHAASPLRLVGCALMIVGFVLIARF